MIALFTIFYAPPYKVLARIGLLLAWASVLPACESASRVSEPTTGPARHVVVIVIDTLRADHLPTYGYGRDTAPFLTDLAKSSVVFTRAVTTSSFTGEAISSLFTGLYPSASPWGAGWYARPAPDRETLATAFREAGYATALFSNSPVLDAPEYFRGFDTTWCGTEFGVSGQGPRLVEKALAWLKAQGDGPTFTYLHFLDPHSPYAPPDDYYDRFGGSRPEDPLDLYRDVREQVPALRASGFGPGEARFEDLVQRYDGEIAFVDDCIKTLFAAMDALGMGDNTLAVILSDHGEEFLDHGFVEHAWTLYPEVYRVPLFFWQPGRLAPARVEETVSLVDILPSLFRVQALPPAPDISGVPLFEEETEGGWAIAPISGPRIMEMCIQSRSLIRGVVTDDALYLAYWKWLSPDACADAAGNLRATREALLAGTLAPVDPWGPIVREALYDLRDDPTAQRDLAGEQPDAVKRWRDYLLDYGRACPPQLPDRFKATRDQSLLSPAERALLEAVDPVFLRPQTPDGEHDHALEALGYL